MLNTIIAWRQVVEMTEQVLAPMQSRCEGTEDVGAHPTRWLTEWDATVPSLSFEPHRSTQRSGEDANASTFELRTFSGPEGSREYLLYVPAALQGPPRALIVMLHGCKQTPEDFAIGTGMNALAEEHGLIVAYPSQSRSDSSLSCWRWFSPRNQRRGTGEPEIIAGMTRELLEEFSVEEATAFVAGLSAGGAMAAIMGDCYPDLFSAVGVHSGLPCHSARGVMSALALMRGRQGSGLASQPDPCNGRPVRTIIFHGTADKTVHPDNAERIATAAQAATEVELECATGVSDGGRRFEATAARADDGRTLTEVWMVEGSSHGWSGGSEAGSYTDPDGPNASAEMLRFFLSD